jgi:hypothetical protein
MKAALIISMLLALFIALSLVRMGRTEGHD